MNPIRYLTLFAGIGLGLLVACSEPRTAGGAGSETNTGITAQILDANGNPQQGVLCRLRPSWYVRRDTSHTALEELPIVSYGNAVTNAQGYVQFEHLEPGSYHLDAEWGQSGVLSRTSNYSTDSMVDMGSLKLAPLGRIEGSLPHFPGAHISLYGTERMTVADSTGNFSLNNVPSGARWVRIEQAISRQLIAEFQAPSHDSVVKINESTLKLHTELLETYEYSIPIEPYMALRDSAFESRPPWKNRNHPYLIEVTYQEMDFSHPAADGSDLFVINSSGESVPFELHLWNPLYGRARLWVSYLESGMRLLYGKKGAVAPSHATTLWEDWSEAAKDSLFTLHIDDFEDGNTMNLLPSYLKPSSWYMGYDTTALASFAILEDSQARSKNALFYHYAISDNSWVLVGVRLSEKPIDLTPLDSMVFWARGDGRIYAAIENNLDEAVDKAWVSFTLTSDWVRYCIKPSDFAPPGIGGSIGWEATKSLVNSISFFGIEGTQFWIDDISLHGLHPLEYR